ncbi:MAG TPA: M1 family aminopeptidase [Acidobacteriota bacterium]
MRPVLACLLLTALPSGAEVVRGHRLPEGTERPVRERGIDIQHLAADLRIDLEQESVAGEVRIRFTPLRSGLSELVLDQAELAIESVELEGSPVPLAVEIQGRALRVALPEPIEPGSVATLRIVYDCEPKSGLYFFPPAPERAAQAWNYGEGGRHYGWLPLYNDTNDRFSVELEASVARPYVVVGNGTLESVTDNPDGTRRYRWVQRQPIANYLLALNVGELSEVVLDRAAVGAREVPLSVWTSPGTEAATRHAFGATPAMIEHFSELLGYPYPWDKYDQLALREFAIGAMETATAVGFSESHLHLPGDPPDSAPEFELAYPTWTYTDTIAHELAHHWFGDLVTCRSLASIWLNESFASFFHTWWTGQADGEGDMTYQRWRYLDRYLDYVHREGKVRPLEYFRYSAPGAMYQSETTYIKGSLVLHLLRHILGDDDFFRALSDYLRRHEYGEVESNDLQRALEQASGRNLGWFFDDWIQGGGGHPQFEVSYHWAPERGQVDLTVEQIQSDLPFENDFRLPVDVEIVTAAGAQRHTIELSGWETHVALPCGQKPVAVIFDKGGWLIAEVQFERTLEELLYLLERDDLAGRLRAARALAHSYPRRDQTADALERTLADPRNHWGLRQEAALDLGTIGGERAAAALAAAAADPDAKVRRAVAVALGRLGGERGAELLRGLIERDGAEDVIGAAALSLGKIGAPAAREVLTGLLERDSRWWDALRVGALQGLAELADPALVPIFRDYVGAEQVQEARSAALKGWLGAAPDDPALAQRLRELVHDRNFHLRELALELIEQLHRQEDLEFLREFAAAEPDPDLAQAAREAAQTIESFVLQP